MKPAPFTYHAPSSTLECLELLAQHGDDAALLAGGQSLVPLLRFRLAQPAHVIAIGNIGEELDAIRVTDVGLSIGARVTYAMLQCSREVAHACPALLPTLELVAHPAVRTRGTLCGNLCQADPASELPALALVAQARLRLRSAGGERVVEAQDFFQGPYMTARRADEMLVEVVFPRRPAAQKYAIREVTRLRGGFPMAGVAVALVPGTGGRIDSASIAVFGVHAQQIRLPGAEAALCELGYTPRGVCAAEEALDRAIHPHADPFASAPYRRAAARTLLRRALEDIHGTAPTA